MYFDSDSYLSSDSHEYDKKNADFVINCSLFLL